VSLFAWVNALSIMLAAWFGASYGLSVLAWALAGRGILGLVLVAMALKIGLERPVWPLLRLLALPAGALVAARVAAFLALAHASGLGLLGQLVLAGVVASAVFGGIVLGLAPARMVAMTSRLHRALRRGDAI